MSDIQERSSSHLSEGPLFSVSGEAVAAFRKMAKLVEANDTALTRFDGNFPTGTLFSLVYDGHAADKIDSFYDPEAMDQVFNSFRLSNRDDAGNWGPFFAVKPELLDLQSFDYTHFLRPSQGLILHFGMHQSLPKEGVAGYAEMVFEDQELQGQLMKMRVAWVFLPENGEVLSLQPRSFAPVCGQSFTVA